jgi:gliding motility-associated-like protein
MAQLTAPDAKAVRYTTYPLAPGVKDPVFIFCNSSGSQTGTIIASSTGGTAPFNFSWSKWSDVTKSFSIPVKNDPGVITSTCAGLGEGGYRVRITDGGSYDTSLVGWIFLDNPFVQARLLNYTCDYVAITGKVAVDTFYYRYPGDGSYIKLKNGTSFLWASTPASVIPYPNIDTTTVTYTPPLEDVVYKLQVVDSFLCTSEATFPYTSIQVKADFSFDPNKGEAPLEVSFTDKSVRGYTYVWNFGDHSVDSASLLKDPLPHIYYKPGEYTVNLIVTSDQGCVGTMTSEKITVDPSELHIPNVFTPDGDGINDYFVVESKSLRDLSVEVFSRSGVLVYSFSSKDESLKDWLGWDGNVNSSSSKATPGVYFYIIKAAGWDDETYDNKGFLYLYR